MGNFHHRFPQTATRENNIHFPSHQAEAVHLAIDNIEPNCQSLPAQLVQPTIGKLIWFSDKPATSKLKCV
ncbi:hypothetical protein ES319_D04G221600v1 [Gossypium barbadense]|uniref:Uncharacterized protein n=2 Tax=Gossypium TaxID=3633 RepID=A0A5J5S396_GOSBA|nr:hypothetical protein ES319_D04G221600v1 [Gossypium barbadense]TYG75042.1 hypothetical protein ES288_D04G232100v1 [Gossypium darwinii]